MAVRRWAAAHGGAGRAAGRAVRRDLCFLPVTSPWLNPIGPRWAHATRTVGQSDRRLSARELAARAGAALRGPDGPHHTLAETAA